MLVSESVIVNTLLHREMVLGRVLVHFMPHEPNTEHVSEGMVALKFMKTLDYADEEKRSDKVKLLKN